MSKFFFKQDNKDNWKVIWQFFKDYIAELKKNNKDFYIHVKTHKTSPTIRQRAYYYGVVLPTIKQAMEEQGNIINADKLDYDLREVIGFTEINYNSIDKTYSTRVKSLSDISGSKGETVDYLTKLIIWAEEFFNIEIPRPQVRGYDFYLTNSK